MDVPPALLLPEELRATAELARLLVSDAELEPLRRELGAVLAYVAELRTIVVTGVPPMTHGVALPCPLREDELGTHDPAASALGNAPATEGAFFSVPAILVSAPKDSVTGDSPAADGSLGS